MRPLRRVQAIHAVRYSIKLESWGWKLEIQEFSGFNLSFMNSWR